MGRKACMQVLIYHLRQQIISGDTWDGVNVSWARRGSTAQENFRKWSDSH